MSTGEITAAPNRVPPSPVPAPPSLGLATPHSSKLLRLFTCPSIPSCTCSPCLSLCLGLPVPSDCLSASLSSVLSLSLRLPPSRPLPMTEGLAAETRLAFRVLLSSAAQNESSPLASTCGRLLSVSPDPLTLPPPGLLGSPSSLYRSSESRCGLSFDVVRRLGGRLVLCLSWIFIESVRFRMS